MAFRTPHRLDPPTKALTFHCGVCSRAIGARKTHYYLSEARILICDRCLFRKASTRPLHAKYYPDCPEDWHDLWDHRITHCTKAGYRRLHHYVDQEFDKIVANV